MEQVENTCVFHMLLRVLVGVHVRVAGSSCGLCVFQTAVRM